MTPHPHPCTPSWEDVGPRHCGEYPGGWQTDAAAGLPSGGVAAEHYGGTTLRASLSGTFLHTPSFAFRHIPPNSARFSNAAEGALFISAQLSMQRPGQRPPKGSGIDMTVEAT